MKYFIRISLAYDDDVWSMTHSGLLYARTPADHNEYMECIDEISKYSKCSNCGRCCEHAPELTVEEKKQLQFEYPDVELITGKPCPFRKKNKCILHNKTNGLTKPVQCQSYICKPVIRNIRNWLKDFCNHFLLEFDDVSRK